MLHVYCDELYGLQADVRVNNIKESTRSPPIYPPFIIPPPHPLLSAALVFLLPQTLLPLPHLSYPLELLKPKNGFEEISMVCNNICIKIPFYIVPL